jgi:hypothetical protein
MESLKFYLARHALPFYTLQVGHPFNGLQTISGMAVFHGVSRGGPNTKILKLPYRQPIERAEC